MNGHAHHHRYEDAQMHWRQGSMDSMRLFAVIVCCWSNPRSCFCLISYGILM